MSETTKPLSTPYRIGAMNESGRDLERSRGAAYINKPRPSVIIQDNSFDRTQSVTVCGFATNPTDAPFFRLTVEPNERNGLRMPCRLMVDKITTVPKSKIGAQVGKLDYKDVVRLNRAITVLLGLAASPNATGGSR